MESETEGRELTRDLKKMLCSCRFGGALKPGTCEDVEILGEGESTETAGQRDRAKIFLQCQAAMETFFWWDDQAVFMAELLAEIGPTRSEGTGEHFFHAAGGLGLVTLGLPVIVDAALIDKCPPEAATQTKSKIESGDVTAKLTRACSKNKQVNALLWFLGGRNCFGGSYILSNVAVAVTASAEKHW